MADEHPAKDPKFWLTILFTICGTVIAGVTAWMGWMSITLIGMKSQVEMLSLQQRDVIPPVVEASFRDLRTKDSKTDELIAKLTEAALENRQQIGFLKEKLNTK